MAQVILKRESHNKPEKQFNSRTHTASSSRRRSLQSHGSYLFPFGVVGKSSSDLDGIDHLECDRLDVSYGNFGLRQVSDTKRRS